MKHAFTVAADVVLALGLALVVLLGLSAEALPLLACAALVGAQLGVLSARDPAALFSDTLLKLGGCWIVPAVAAVLVVPVSAFLQYWSRPSFDVQACLLYYALGFGGLIAAQALGLAVAWRLRRSA